MPVVAAEVSISVSMVANELFRLLLLPLLYNQMLPPEPDYITELPGCVHSLPSLVSGFWKQAVAVHKNYFSVHRPSLTFHSLTTCHN